MYLSEIVYRVLQAQRGYADSQRDVVPLRMDLSTGRVPG